MPSAGTEPTATTDLTKTAQAATAPTAAAAPPAPVADASAAAPVIPAATAAADTPKAATLAELRAAFPADLEFCATALDQRMTLDTAYAAYGRKAAQNAALAGALGNEGRGAPAVPHAEKTRAAAQQAPAAATGISSLRLRPGQPIPVAHATTYDQVIQAYVGPDHKMTLGKAHYWAQINHPDLHEDWKAEQAEARSAARRARRN